MRTRLCSRIFTPLLVLQTLLAYKPPAEEETVPLPSSQTRAEFLANYSYNLVSELIDQTEEYGLVASCKFKPHYVHCGKGAEDELNRDYGQVFSKGNKVSADGWRLELSYKYFVRAGQTGWMGIAVPFTGIEKLNTQTCGETSFRTDKKANFVIWQELKPGGQLYVSQIGSVEGGTRPPNDLLTVSSACSDAFVADLGNMTLKLIVEYANYHLSVFLKRSDWFQAKACIENFKTDMSIKNKDLVFAVLVVDSCNVAVKSRDLHFYKLENAPSPLPLLEQRFKTSTEAANQDEDEILQEGAFDNQPSPEVTTSPRMEPTRMATELSQFTDSTRGYQSTRNTEPIVTQIQDNVPEPTRKQVNVPEPIRKQDNIPEPTVEEKATTASNEQGRGVERVNQPNKDKLEERQGVSESGLSSASSACHSGNFMAVFPFLLICLSE